MLHGATPRIKLPITIPVLDQIWLVLDRSSNPNKVVLWAIACSAFFGFFRLGELLPVSACRFHQRTNLAWGDVAVDSLEEPHMARVHLKVSKCDQLGGGVDVFLGRKGTPLCPVATIICYIAIRGNSQGAFFLDSCRGIITKA
jgi:hypothetical protein